MGLSEVRGSTPTPGNSSGFDATAMGDECVGDVELAGITLQGKSVIVADAVDGSSRYTFKTIRAFYITYITSLAYST